MSSQISIPHIELLYVLGKNAGALGGKILGAGGGGFFLFYVPEKRQNHVKEVLTEYRQVNFEFEREGSRIIFLE